MTETQTNVYQHDDIIYYNAVSFNRSNNLERASYFKTFGDNILDNCEQYYMAVTRFAISHMYVPLYFFQNGKYSVTINNSKVDLIYQPEGNYFGFPNNQPVFYYKTIQNMVNSALFTAFNNAAVGGGSAPFINYNPTSEKFELYVNAQNIFAAPHQFNLYFNAPLFQQFQYFQAFFNGFNQPNGQDYKIYLVEDPADLNKVTLGGVDYFKYIQEQPGLYLFNEIESILFLTNNIPVKAEYVGVQSGGNESVQVPILTNFIPDQSVARNLAQYQYYSNGNYKLINMTGNSKLNTVDFQLAIRTRSGEIVPLYLEPGESMSVSFVFAMKSLYNNQFSHLYNFENDESFYMPIVDNIQDSESGRSVSGQVMQAANNRERFRMENNVRNTVNNRFAKRF